MARIFVADHPKGNLVDIEIKPDIGGIFEVNGDVLDDVKGGEYLPLLNDIEWSVADLVVTCLKKVDALDAKARLQVVAGVLADLRLRFQG